MFREEAPGVWVAPAETVMPVPEWLRDGLRADAWRPAVIGGGTPTRVRTSKRWAGSIMRERFPRGIDTCEAEAMALARPLLESLSPTFATLRPRGSEFVHYNRFGFFSTHRDAGGSLRRRCFTIMRYLNECTGGATAFPELGYAKQPRAGDWLMFYAEHVHAGMPVLGGEKIMFVTALDPVD